MNRSRALLQPTPTAWQNAGPVALLKLGYSPFTLWVSFLIAVIITVSAFDDVRLFILPDENLKYPWLALGGTVMYWLVWMSLAFMPKITAPIFVVMLAAMLPQVELGGPLLLAFGAIALGAYRVSIRSLAVMVGSFLIWQLLWVPFVSGLGVVQLWAYFPVTLLITTPGLAIKLMRERAINVERAQKLSEETAAKAAQEQRMALARELHDVVTHGLTMIAVQANLGTITPDSAAQRHALNEIGSMARNSLDDLRRLLKTIRADEAAVAGKPSSETSVQPSPATIDLALSVAESQKRLNGLGCPTMVSTSGELDSTPNGLRSTVLRILQEGATNVVKHSDSSTRCEILMDVREDRIELVIKNLMTPGRPRLPVSGTGLAGLRERASRLGGTLEAGPENGWWSVRTVLPFKERQTLH